MTGGRIPPLAPDSLDEMTREFIRSAERTMGFLPNDGLTMARVPGLVEAASAMAAAAYRPGEVGMETKRLVALMTSSAAGCVYCQSHNRFGGLNRWNDTIQTEIETLPAQALPRH